jgi:nicotinate-nucleotide adenylyltransferase
MGGTFDPIHHGHLVAASEVSARFGLDEVIFVPTGEPWQKTGRTVSSAEDRYLMTVVATASNPQFSVDRADIERPGATYTVDTLRELRDRYPNAELFFITGADALAQILSWHKVEELFELAHFVGDPRRGARAGDLVDRVPAPGQRRTAGLVPGAGRGRPVHLETLPVSGLIRKPGRIRLARHLMTPV